MKVSSIWVLDNVSAVFFSFIANIYRKFFMLSKYITNFYIKGRFVTSSKSWNLKNFTIYGDLTSLKPISLHLANNSCHNKTVLRFCGRYRANKRSEWPCLPTSKRSIDVTPPWDQGVLCQNVCLPYLFGHLCFFSFGTTEAFPLFC